MLSLRRATPADADALAALLRAVWPDESTQESRIAAALWEATHTALLVHHDERLLGLVDSFETRDSNGHLRWEVDLLAVHPDARGQGVGSQLVQAATEVGWQRGSHFARGLVATDNLASQRTFARCGYHSTGEEYRLFLSSDGEPSDDHEDNNTLLVSTFRYRGLWVEGGLTVARLHAAQQQRARHALDVVGAVIPLSHPASLDAAQAAGFTEAGRYHWWETTGDRG